MTYRLAPLLLVCACAHAPAAPLPVDLPARLATAADIAAIVVEVEASRSDSVGLCVVGPVLGGGFRTAASYLRGQGALSGFSFDPTPCGVSLPSVPIPMWVDSVLEAVARGTADLSCSLASPFRWLAEVGKALTAWGRDTSIAVVVPDAEVCP